MFVGYRNENVVNMLTDFGVEAVIIRIQLPSLVEIFEHNINAFGVHQEKASLHIDVANYQLHVLLHFFQYNACFLE